MNHVYWQTTAVFTNVIDNIMNHVYWQTKLDYEPCLLANKGGIYHMIPYYNIIDNIMNHVY